MLRNQLYIGRVVWNRRGTVKDPVSGIRHRRAKNPDKVVVRDHPELRVIPHELWERVQARLVQEQAPHAAASKPSAVNIEQEHRFWERRRPRRLLTGKVVCGACSALFASLGNGYTGCRAAKQNACRNTKRIRRARLEAYALDMLSRQLMDPAPVAEFVSAFSAEWNKLVAAYGAGGAARRRELQAIERKIANLTDAINEGIRSPDLQTRLIELQ